MAGEREGIETTEERDAVCFTPFHDKTVVITNCGRLCLYCKKINLSTCLAGQAVGIKEVDDGIWLVSFRYILLPMSPGRTGSCSRSADTNTIARRILPQRPHTRMWPCSWGP